MEQMGISQYIGWSACGVFGLSIFISCHKDHQHHKTQDHTKPEFAIEKPTANAVYKQGDTVWIKGTVTDNELHELKLEIVRNSDNTTLYHDAISMHGLTSYQMNKFWKSSVTDNTDATLIITAVDHEPNKGEIRIPISIIK